MLTNIIKEDKEYPIDKLREDPLNVRLHPEYNIEAIKKSLQEFGQHSALVCREDGTVIVGNGRLKAMKALGWKTAWVIFVDDDTEKAIRRSIADNRTAELAEWDWEKLNKYIKEYDIIGFDNIKEYIDDDIKIITDDYIENNKKKFKNKCPRCGYEW